MNKTFNEKERKRNSIDDEATSELEKDRTPPNKLRIDSNFNHF